MQYPVPIAIQSDRAILDTTLVASSLSEILQ